MCILSYSETFRVEPFECDTERRMSLGAVLRRVQQISTVQCDALGLTHDLYATTHTAFLLVRMVAQFNAAIPMGAQITLLTTPSAPVRAIYHRHTQLCNDSGEVLCDVFAHWVLVDTETRRILRKPPENLPMPFLVQSFPDFDITVHKAEVLPLGEERAAYTRCDINHHLNNTIYADIIYDNLPQELLMSTMPTRFAITYHREVPQNAAFTLYRGQTETGSYYFAGENGEMKHFEAEISF